MWPLLCLLADFESEVLCILSPHHRWSKIKLALRAEMRSTIIYVRRFNLIQSYSLCYRIPLLNFHIAFSLIQHKKLNVSLQTPQLNVIHIDFCLKTMCKMEILEIDNQCNVRITNNGHPNQIQIQPTMENTCGSLCIMHYRDPTGHDHNHPGHILPTR